MENFLGAVGAVISFILWIPQAALIWKNRGDALRLAGISPLTQYLVIANAITWGTYSFYTHAYWAGAPGIINLPLAVISIYFIKHAQRAVIA